MVLTALQSKGLKIALDRYSQGERYTVISGYAGTGKSTLVRHIIEALNVHEEDVAYATFTGAAAEVLRRKGNKTATTLHKLLYNSRPKKNGEFYNKPKEFLEQSVVVVDECSMVPKTMVKLILSYDVYVIFLGDPGQLPVLNKNEEHNLLDNPHVFLDQIMRQAEESEIIRLSMQIRNGEQIKPFRGKDVMIIPKKEFCSEQLLWADQIICATNKTRNQLNRETRKLKGFFGEIPMDGEKMICLKNHWDRTADVGESFLVNGLTGIVSNVYETNTYIPYKYCVKKHDLDVINVTFISGDNSIFNNIKIDKTFLTKGVSCLEPKDCYLLNKVKERIGDLVPYEFDYGYCITGHKSQGSSWEKVLVMEEKFPFDKEEHMRWLYTVCTRPQSKLVLVINN